MRAYWTFQAPSPRLSSFTLEERGVVFIEEEDGALSKHPSHIYGEDESAFVFGADGERSRELEGVVGIGLATSDTRGLACVLEQSGQVWGGADMRLFFFPLFFTFFSNGPMPTVTLFKIVN
jgi:hypothetical protein